MTPISDLPVYFLFELAGSQPAKLNPLQEFFLPYSGYMHAFWWMCYYGTLSYMASKFVLIPLLENHLLSGRKKSVEAPEPIKKPRKK